MTGRRRRRGTPATLQLLSVLVLVAGVAAGGTGYLALGARADAVRHARTDARQVARLQLVRTTLVVADAAAGDDVLRGQAPGGSRERQYGYAVQPAVTGLTALATDSAAPGTLAVAALRVTRWSGTAQTARVLARQGDPRAVPTLRSASVALRGEVLPVVAAAQGEAAAALDRDGRPGGPEQLLAALVAVAALALLLGAHGWLTVRFRRLLAPPLAAAVVVGLVAAGAAAVLVTRSEGRARAVTAGPAAVARRLVEARTAAFEARAVEALGVVTGTTPTADERWRPALADAGAALDRARALAGPAASGDREALATAATLLAGYGRVHGALVDAARAGNRPAEVAVALDPSTRGAVGSFDGFDAQSGALLARQVQAADDGWAAAGAGLRPAAWAVLAAGVLAGALGAGALRARLHEYR